MKNLIKRMQREAAAQSATSTKYAVASVTAKETRISYYRSRENALLRVSNIVCRGYNASLVPVRAIAIKVKQGVVLANLPLYSDYDTCQRAVYSN